MDYQALGVGLAAIVTAVGAVITGIYTGRSNKAKDESQGYVLMEQAETERNIALENATKGRIDALVQDANDARRRTREAEQENEERQARNRREVQILENTIANERRHGQRGWELASHHFNTVLFLSHLLNNIFTVVTMTPGQDPEHAVLLGIVKNAMARMASVTIPKTLESAMPGADNTSV